MNPKSEKRSTWQGTSTKWNPQTTTTYKATEFRRYVSPETRKIFEHEICWGLPHPLIDWWTERFAIVIKTFVTGYSGVIRQWITVGLRASNTLNICRKSRSWGCRRGNCRAFIHKWMVKNMFPVRSMCSLWGRQTNCACGCCCGKGSITINRMWATNILIMGYLSKRCDSRTSSYMGFTTV